MLRDEMLLCAKLQHPAIIRFYGCSWTPPDVFIVLEFAERGSLKDLLRARDLSVTLEGVLLRMAHEIAGGMHYLHTRPRPVMHRDIKVRKPNPQTNSTRKPTTHTPLFRSTPTFYSSPSQPTHVERQRARHVHLCGQAGRLWRL